jgi:hypothetical protein
LGPISDYFPDEESADGPRAEVSPIESAEHTNGAGQTRELPELVINESDPIAPESTPEELPPLPFINMSNWDHEPVPEQEWAVLDRVPSGQTTLFTGEGGYGKSTMQLHLCAAHALGLGWLNTLPEPGPAVFFEAEDGEKTIHRRLAAIATHYGTSFENMIAGGLHVISMFGRDAVLATPTRNGKIEPTPLYRQLLQAAGDIKPKMIGIASSANVFAGSEIDRTQTQQFIGLLNRTQSRGLARLRRRSRFTRRPTKGYAWGSGGDALDCCVIPRGNGGDFLRHDTLLRVTRLGRLGNVLDELGVSFQPRQSDTLSEVDQDQAGRCWLRSLIGNRSSSSLDPVRCGLFGVEVNALQGRQGVGIGHYPIHQGR